MTLNYSKKVMENFLHPRNMGKIENADGVGKVGNSVCGDILNLYIKVGKKKIRGKLIEYIKDIKFQTLGCGAAIAVSSMITQLAKGKTLEEAEKISNKDIVHELEGLPPVKYHCSLLGADALHLAIKDYLSKNKHEK
ncbi:iron-sulfur cluster assembly scaffold protein [Candidatus Pacearchaeota archaeon]|nr:iron-sulfur cluster assembly scaffold protein [Candidatus Pacearchaeota archaeon]